MCTDSCFRPKIFELSGFEAKLYLLSPLSRPSMFVCWSVRAFLLTVHRYLRSFIVIFISSCAYLTNTISPFIKTLSRMLKENGRR